MTLTVDLWGVVRNMRIQNKLCLKTIFLFEIKIKIKCPVNIFLKMETIFFEE